jgi:N-formylglutamate amidohydrolase
MVRPVGWRERAGGAISPFDAAASETSLMHPSDRASAYAELDPPFLVWEPARPGAPFVLSSPHSGRIYPKAFLAASRLDARTLRKSEDCYVEELFGACVPLGAPLIAATFPRCYLDVNREPYELDPGLFHGRLPDYANTQSVRVVGGLGTIARIVSDTEEIYRERLDVGEALERIERLYKPFHARLAGLIEAARQRFGCAVLIDCHSMPSANPAAGGPSRPDVVLGDRFGSSCESDLTRLARDVFAAEGLQVALNRPYAGGFITEHYGRPSRGMHALQIEINRALYMNEDTFERTAAYDQLQATLERVLDRLFAEYHALRLPRAAAE